MACTSLPFSALLVLPHGGRNCCPEQGVEAGRGGAGRGGGGVGGRLTLLPEGETSHKVSVRSPLFSAFQSSVEESFAAHLSFPDFFTAFVSQRRCPLLEVLSFSRAFYGPRQSFFVQLWPCSRSSLSECGLPFLERNNYNKSFLSSLKSLNPLLTQGFSPGFLLFLTFGSSYQNFEGGMISPGFSSLSVSQLGNKLLLCSC